METLSAGKPRRLTMSSNDAMSHVYLTPAVGVSVLILILNMSERLNACADQASGQFKAHQGH